MKQGIYNFFWRFGSLAIGCLWVSGPISAQIVPDATMPVNSTVTPQGNTLNITGGTSAGGNLFHSFREFSLPAGTAAHFNNSIDIQNIITRVTGGAISNIDGLIKANGTANLFLLNPSGLIFGPNASLNIGGSFLASTASSIKLADGNEFSATNPAAPPLLTVNVPVGLQLGENPGGIVVRGAGHNMSYDSETRAIIRSNRPAGLQVSAGKTLALVGGDISLVGGNITAEEGRIELGSVGAGSSVSLTPNSAGWELDYSGVGNFQDIQLSGAASADVSGSGSGKIEVRGRRVTFSEGSAIIGLTEGGNSGGTLSVRAAESVDLIGTTADGQFPSGLFASTTPNSTGSGGNLTVETGRLTLRDRAQISAITFGAGDAGTLTLRATESVELIGSKLYADVNSGATGSGGDLTLETGRLTLRDGAQIGAGTSGAGDGGTLRVRARESVDLIGTPADGQFPTGLFTSAQPNSTGNGGDLIVETGRLTLRDGAQIGAGTFGAGEGGTLTVRARESVELIASGLFASAVSAGPNSTGNGGNLTVETGRLTLVGGAQIGAGTFGAGDGGTLTVRATESVELIGTTADGLYPTALLAAAEPGATGNGGDLTLETGRLTLVGGAQIATSTFGVGDGGTLTVRARESVELIASGLFASVGPDSTGNGGNLTVETGRLTLAGGAQIAAATSGAGDGGTLTVRATESVELIGTTADGEFPSGLFASAEPNSTGNGGDLTLETGRLTVRDGATIDATSFATGAAGNLIVSASAIRLDNKASVRANTSAGGGNITLNAGSLQLRRNSRITTNAQGNSPGGNITFNTDTIAALENSDISANSQENFGGKVTINAQGIFGTEYRLNPTSNSDITATGGSPELNGVVTINTPNTDPTSGLIQLPSQLRDVTGLINNPCAALARGSSFTVTGKGGIPQSPTDPLTGTALAVDWISPPTETPAAPTLTQEIPKSPNPGSPPPLVEAIGWVISSTGSVTLTANPPNGTPGGTWQVPANCPASR